MSQELILREGTYECPECKSLFLLTNPKVEDGDGYCDCCTDGRGESIRLVFRGESAE